MTELSRSSKIVVNKDVVSCDLGGETAMLDMKEGVYYGLNEIGTVIWELIQNPITLLEIIDKILEEYEVDEETCYADTVELIKEMEKNGLVAIK
ncbi:PqqD family peptide modification chaperone [Methanobacterium sp.]|uniref:PqqD family peptide modification chaperone n=1 Tax=Methanobacterium sp. TaxID=2164 RepID=UPI0025CD72B8|nr:PqqD family peptide modification chaperone [Methanobacterium sp.]MBI5459355.1 PqqD family protein [Methanobacterium sp.]